MIESFEDILMRHADVVLRIEPNVRVPKNIQKKVVTAMCKSADRTCVIGPAVYETKQGRDSYYLLFVMKPKGREALITRITCGFMSYSEAKSFRANLQRFVRDDGFTVHVPENELDMATLCNRLWPCQRLANIEAGILRDKAAGKWSEEHGEIAA